MPKTTTKKQAPRPKGKASNKSGGSDAGPDGAASIPRFVQGAHRAVRAHLAASTDLPTFIASAGALTLGNRRRLVEQALVLIEENYVHRPLKESMHGVDPVQRLRLVKHRLQQATTSTMGSEHEFHREMLKIFNSVRDLHTNYLLPAPFKNTVAFLPFDVEEYFENGQAHYIATHFVQGFTHAHFKSGVEIKMWNGVPVDRAIDVSADLHAGSNAAARHARGIDGLTIRPLRTSLPPDEFWVVIGYTDRHGISREVRQDWIVTQPLADGTEVGADSARLEAACIGLDLGLDIIRRTRTLLFAPAVVGEQKRKPKLSKRPAAAGASVTTSLPGVFRAKSVTTPAGEFGCIRIFTFSVRDPAGFVDEFIRLVELLPQEGLIIDVRGNGGGHIWASEGLLQVLTPLEVQPEPVQFTNTALNLRICERHKDNPVGIDLGPWMESIRRSVETGAIYSRGFPITPVEFANRWGQRYHGPVVLITDARCYSATDIFAAGFQDHDIGKILGVDDNTGAGGANVWTHGLLRELLRLPRPVDPDSPYHSLPGDAGMRVSMRRMLRVGEQSGTPLEDLGVTPDLPYSMRKEDLVNGNVELMKRAGAILATMPVRRLSLSTTRSGSTLNGQATTVGLTRLDIFLDGHPQESRSIADGQHGFSVVLPAGANLLRLAGYDGGAFVAARKIQL